MRKNRLRNRLLWGAIGIVVAVMALSTVVVSTIVWRQNEKAVREHLTRAFTVMTDDLASIGKKLRADAAQITKVEDMGARLKYTSSMKTDTKSSSVKETRRKMAIAMHRVAMTGNIWLTGIYDAEGDLVASARVTDEGSRLTFAVRFPDPIYEAFEAAADAEIKNKDWEENAEPPLIGTRFEGELPKSVTSRFGLIGDTLCLVVEVPVMALDYDMETGEPVDRQYGVVFAARRLGAGFSSRLSRLTDTDVNLFAGDAFKVGETPAYSKLRDGGGETIEVGGLPVLLNEMAVGDDDYYQGVLKLAGESGPVGAVSALHSKAHAHENTRQMLKLLIVVSLICVLLVIPVTLVFSNSIIRPLKQVIDGLEGASEEVTSATDQIAMAGQELADGASRQAASNEETSSALEEMTSMIRQNAENAGQLSQLLEESGTSMERSYGTLRRTNTCMQKIAETGEETGKIIKTIDEIAFQTNLLALNAAVEAARAGEAGAGFAVVADEVRNLAMRAAEAARNTANLIGESLEQIREGSTLVAGTVEEFDRVQEHNREVAELFQEIHSASQEQARGAEQISRAMADMDEVVQQNAANAEESASSTASLRMQTHRIQRLVEDLVGMVGTAGQDGRFLGGNGPQLPGGQRRLVARPAREWEDASDEVSGRWH